MKSLKDYIEAQYKRMYSKDVTEYHPDHESFVNQKFSPTLLKDYEQD